MKEKRNVNVNNTSSVKEKVKINSRLFCLPHRQIVLLVLRTFIFSNVKTRLVFFGHFAPEENEWRCKNSYLFNRGTRVPPQRADRSSRVYRVIEECHEAGKRHGVLIFLSEE